MTIRSTDITNSPSHRVSPSKMTVSDRAWNTRARWWSTSPGSTGRWNVIPVSPPSSITRSASGAALSSSGERHVARIPAVCPHDSISRDCGYARWVAVVCAPTFR